ncbi:RNA polymerase sigma factor [Streptomyces sp. NPDC053367]|uniref:RNA polymerase sigma factor n=1 Tax=Streptomyces sp. NPDC053367 TaxID=3365700 RepID=UPI0037D7D828
MDERHRALRQEELGTLVAERYEQMVGYARKQLRGFGVPPWSADARDVVQNALAGVLACPEPVGRLRPYVFAAIRNEARHAARRCRTGQGYASLDADVRLETAAGTADPCATADLRLDLDAALTALPLQQRRAVLLTKGLGLTQAETATVLGTAPGTVATHTSRAVAALRLALGAVAVVLVVCAAQWLRRSGVTPVGAAAGGAAVSLLLWQLSQWWISAATLAAMAGAWRLGLGGWWPFDGPWTPRWWARLLPRRRARPPRRPQEPPASASLRWSSGQGWVDRPEEAAEPSGAVSTAGGDRPEEAAEPSGAVSTAAGGSTGFRGRRREDDPEPWVPTKEQFHAG